MVGWVVTSRVIDSVSLYEAALLAAIGKPALVRGTVEWASKITEWTASLNRGHHCGTRTVTSRRLVRTVLPPGQLADSRTLFWLLQLPSVTTVRGHDCS